MKQKLTALLLVLLLLAVTLGAARHGSSALCRR